eukprot:TRINITY_DN35033_c0_g1_i1.p1 TRINITY_DN35033_c0_g1~~TRINITY_DN35033_c0_g1_i1.p1  ORF type:complete len:176 (-),score=1.24 TRINITY_DN35033_c0_g1_i1:105-632(-)
MFSGSNSNASSAPAKEVDDRGPRIFTQDMKTKCWEQADWVIGRDPDRWRRDRFGHIVVAPLRSCYGPLCYEFDHRIPFAKGGKTSVDNCDILMTCVNRLKSAKVEFSDADIGDRCPRVFRQPNVAPRQLDLIEYALFGNVTRYENGKWVKTDPRGNGAAVDTPELSMGSWWPRNR